MVVPAAVSAAVRSASDAARRATTVASPPLSPRSCCHWSNEIQATGGGRRRDLLSRDDAQLQAADRDVVASDHSGPLHQVGAEDDGAGGRATPSGATNEPGTAPNMLIDSCLPPAGAGWRDAQQGRVGHARAALPRP